MACGHRVLPETTVPSFEKEILAQPDYHSDAGGPFREEGPLFFVATE